MTISRKSTATLASLHGAEDDGLGTALEDYWLFPALHRSSRTKVDFDRHIDPIQTETECHCSVYHVANFGLRAGEYAQMKR